jgi:hypothetical protein
MTNSSGTNFDRKAGRAAVDPTDGGHNLINLKLGSGHRGGNTRRDTAARGNAV